MDLRGLPVSKAALRRLATVCVKHPNAGRRDLEKCYKSIISIIDYEKKGKKLLFNQNKIKEKVSELVN